MIKKTFYNLPYEKRKRITDAVIKEFMERPNGDYSSQKQTMKIMRNIVDSFKANDDLVSEYLKNRFNMALTNNEIYTMVDRQNLKFQDNESVKCLIEILTQVLKNAIFDVFVAGSDREEVRERLIKKIDIIKQGAVK